MNRKLFLVISIAFCLSLCVGCGKSQKDLALERVKKLNEEADIMMTITDQASFGAARPKLKVLIDYRREMYRKRMERLKSMSPEEQENWEKRQKEITSTGDFQQKQREAVLRYLAEHDRIMKTPGIGELYRELSGDTKTTSADE